MTFDLDTILGTLSPARFLKEYWQKKPLLIRNAFPGFEGLLTPEELMSLSSNEGAQSRVVRFHRGKWTLANGPFKKSDFAKSIGNWTLLVQGVNHFLPEAEALIKAFNFIPHARLDDVMVSFAPNGGGVGPHIDSYDVFLLQGKGERLWQIGKQEDKRLKPDAPIRILNHFEPEQEWLLKPGDMLYLPPQYAHNGIAVGDCMTYSIGFRAPTHQELAQEFLVYLQDHLDIDGMYADPELTHAKHPACISDEMINKVSAVIKKIRFGKKEIKNFLGTYLSEPKAHLFFDPPESPLPKNKFYTLVKKKGLRLDLKSQMLFTQETLFINGESILFYPAGKSILKKLADERALTSFTHLDEQTVDLLYEWYINGYIHPNVRLS